MNNELRFKSGFVSIIGDPNVGKSTLLNSIIGETVSITSKKPQTTRRNLKGIYNDSDFQIIFVDTPGIHKVKNKLDEYMDLSIKKSLNDIDLILYLIDINSIDIENIEKRIKKISHLKQVKILAINKIDVYNYDFLKIEEKINDIIKIDFLKTIFNDIVYISSLKKKNIDILINTIKNYIPYGPMYYDVNDFTDETEKNIVAEYIRQQCLYKLSDEIPHGIIVVIDKFIEKKDICHIFAKLVCEKDAHKGIIIGKDGKMLKNIGTASRIMIEKFLNKKVNLQIFVSVKKNWRDEETNLINFGFNKKRI